MAQSNWKQSLAHFFKKKVVDPILSPESCLEFSRQCLEEIRMKPSRRHSKSSEVINYEQCIYLVDSLDKAVEAASLFLKHNPHHAVNSLSTEDGKESTLEHFKILCMLAKKVKCFIQGCRNGHWLQAAVMLMNSSDFTASLGLDLELFTVLHPPFSFSPLTLSLDEVSTKWNHGGEFFKEMAFNDEDMLVTKLRTLIRFGQASNDDFELATFLLEKLDRLKQRWDTSIVQGRDLTNLKDLVQIARGGYGTVHKASWLGIDVAVKTFHGTDNPDFKKEVPIFAGLSHPNIVSFLCHGKDMGECFIVMELMEQDLFSLLKGRLRNDRTRSSPFSIFEEFDIMLQIAEAMDYLHKMRVLHRDLKSHNILVRCMKSTNVEGYESVQVKLSDFGLSRTKEFSMTQSHMTPNKGTARWMAPELIKFWNTNDILDTGTTKNEELVENYPFKCDVYSFGMVCLEILTGDVPFPNMTANEVKTIVCVGERPQLPDGCHEKLKALIEKCWNPEASSRPCFGDICTELRYLKSLQMTLKSQQCVKFTIDCLRSVTSNFAESNILGHGQCSVVYEAIGGNGRKVAVKRIKGAVTRLGFEFIKFEMRWWKSVRHPHLVEMLGFCIDDNDLLLVNEYMSQGTLAQYLFIYQETNHAEPFSWKQRLKIALDVVEALDHLHSLGSHFLDVDSYASNVFLDHNLNAKVSGFGLVQGSLPQGAGPSTYIVPEFLGDGGRTKAAHVYSFGVVLMELLTGRPAVNGKQDFVTWFRKEFWVSDPGSATRYNYGALDPHLGLGVNFCSPQSKTVEKTVKGILSVADLAKNCTSDSPEARPDLNQVWSVLRGLCFSEVPLTWVDLPRNFSNCSNDFPSSYFQ